MLPARSSRGIQEAEVWAAADAIIAAGERPTIERVRLKIGRGSPNTVSPMLERWFATLAPRLGVAKTADEQAHGSGQGGAPVALRQALDTVWATAVDAAREQAQTALLPERDRLAQQRHELDAAHQALFRQEAVLAERGLALEQALALARSQLKEQAVQLDRAGRELDLVRSSLAGLVQERDADRRRFDEQLGALAAERQRLEDRASASEKRLLAEVDRARLETRQSVRALQEIGHKHAADKLALEDRNATLGKRVQETQLEMTLVAERLQGAQAREKGLVAALEGVTTAAALPPRRTLKSRPAGSARRGQPVTGRLAAKRLQP